MIDTIKNSASVVSGAGGQPSITFRTVLLHKRLFMLGEEFYWQMRSEQFEKDNYYDIVDIPNNPWINIILE